MRTIDQIFLNIENQNFEMDNYRYFLSGQESFFFFFFPSIIGTLVI